jgi:hypothetical protein
MKINLHIERLILDGLPLGPGDGARVRVAIEKELARLLTENDISSARPTGEALPSLRANPISITNESPPQTVGRQIAHSLYDSLNKR